MLAELFPQKHSYFLSLPLLGPHLEGLAFWLSARGYPSDPIRERIRKAPHLSAQLRRARVRRIGDLSAAQFLAFAQRSSRVGVHLAALVRSLSAYLEEQGVLARRAPSLREQVVARYREHLNRERGLAESTMAYHCATATEFLLTIGFDGKRATLKRLAPQQIAAFLRAIGPRLSRESLQHVVSHLRSFLRFLSRDGEVPRGLESSIDTPRVYRGERLPRSLPWETVRTFLGEIDRSTPIGRRDYAMFLLIATYGLRASEVVSLRLDDIEWRAAQLRVPRAKVTSPLVLPLTKEVGAALIDYLRNARPGLACREVFIRTRPPLGPITPIGVADAFRHRALRGALPIPHLGPHCLRHSLAVHLLRQGTSLKAIGDLLGHRSIESTCVYLRLNVEDLRDAALDLPPEGRR